MLLALKNADSLLQDVLKAVDTNNDGHIEFLGALGKLLQAQSLLKTIFRVPRLRRANRESALAAIQEY